MNATGFEVASAPATSSLEVGQAFGRRYHIIRLLGVGGMGAVYQAWDEELGVAVALKVIRVDRDRGPVSPDLEKRFKNELLLARQVTHKNVVRIHDLGEIDGIKYITMPYVRGEDLSSVIAREGRVPIPRALRIARQISGGLEAAHEAGVVHRDLKPPNVMISGEAADEGQALIMDFGISASATETQSGGVIGTLEYMAPEQAAGTGTDARADIYAFGLIVYEMLAGTRPAATSGQERLDAMRRRVDEGLAPLRTVYPEIPQPLAAVIARCLERDPAARYQTTSALVAALATLDDEGELIPIPPRFGARVIAAAAVLVAMLLGSTFYVARRLTVPPVQRPPMTVLLADLRNDTGEALFDGTLEPALVTALEGASFLTAYRSDAAHQIAAQVRPGSKRMDEALARLVAVREGVNVVVATAVRREGDGYRLTATAVDAATGNQIATREIAVSTRDAVLAAVGKVAAPLRKALGDSTPESKQLAAAETFTAGSLEAAHEYSRGQELQQTNPPEAMVHYLNSVRLDPHLGRAYAGLAVTSLVMKKTVDAVRYYRTALSLLDHMSEREKLRTLGTYYGAIEHDYDKAIQTFEKLVSLFPADDVAYNNLGVAYQYKLDFPKAVAAIKRARDLNPKSAKYQFNYVTFLMYAGDFGGAAAEGERMVRQHAEKGGTYYRKTYVPLGLSMLAKGDVAGARQVYATLEKINPSAAAIGSADMEMYFGRYRAALPILESGIAADEHDKNRGEMALKYIALAEAHAALGQTTEALRAAREAAALSSDESYQFPAARALILAGDDAGAEKIAVALENTLQTQSRSYAQLIRAEIADKHKHYVQAIDEARAAQKQHDSWMAQFLLGRAYVETGRFADAIGSFEACNKRKGEVPDLMFINSATLRYLPALYFWTARAEEGLGSTDAAKQDFTRFLTLRADAQAVEPLVGLARRALAATEVR